MRTGVISGGKGGRVVREESAVVMRGAGCGWFYWMFEYGVDGWDHEERRDWWLQTGKVYTLLTNYIKRYLQNGIYTVKPLTFFSPSLSSQTSQVRRAHSTHLAGKLLGSRNSIRLSCTGSHVNTSS